MPARRLPSGATCACHHPMCARRRSRACALRSAPRAADESPLQGPSSRRSAPRRACRASASAGGRGTACCPSPARESQAPPFRGRRDSLARKLRQRSWPGDATQISTARVQLSCPEKESDLGRRGLGRIRAVHNVALDALGQIATDRALGGLLRVGRAHDVTILGNGALPREHLNDDWTGCHVAHEIRVERPLPMHRVKGARISIAKMSHACADDGKTRLLEATVNLADQVTGDAVRLDNGKGALDRHSNRPPAKRGTRKVSGAPRRPARRVSLLPGRRPANTPAARLQTLKLSPQPHSPVTLGFLKRKASLSPCFTKSITVPSMSVRLIGSTNTFTPRSSKTMSPG